jgi:tRNA nucleotidyltransferase/poly(A) polymerase
LRDALLGRVSHDLDFILPGEVYTLARALADQLGGAFYPLDLRRNYARVVLYKPGEPRQVLDFAPQAGPDLESDLRGRDFTINAIAIELHAPQRLLDPLGGGSDLLAKQLRACSPTAFQQDPLRILRAVRQAVAFSLMITPETRTWMRQAVPGLQDTSPGLTRRAVSHPEGHAGTALRAWIGWGFWRPSCPSCPP